MSIFKLKDIELADPVIFDKKFNIDGMIAHDLVFRPESISPYEAYLALKELFGPPNDTSFDELKTQWQYLLKIPEAYIAIHDWKIVSWSIVVNLEPGCNFTGEQIANEFLNILSSKAERYKSRVKSIIKNPGKCVLQNPHILYYSTAEALLEIAETSCNPNSEIYRSTQQRLLITARQSELCRSAFLMYLSSVEGLLNLIYELYLKKEFREKRFYTRLSREDIDIKIRLAPVYCECFQESIIDHKNGIFKNFHTLANLRNDFVHANLTKPMMTPIIYEDDFEFLIDIEEYSEIGLPKNLGEFSIAHVKIAKTHIDELIEYLIGSMTSRFRREFQELIQEEYITVEYENREIFVIS